MRWPFTLDTPLNQQKYLDQRTGSPTLWLAIRAVVVLRLVSVQAWIVAPFHRMGDDGQARCDPIIADIYVLGSTLLAWALVFGPARDGASFPLGVLGLLLAVDIHQVAIKNLLLRPEVQPGYRSRGRARPLVNMAFDLLRLPACYALFYLGPCRDSWVYDTGHRSMDAGDAIEAAIYFCTSLGASGVKGVGADWLSLFVALQGYATMLLFGMFVAIAVNRYSDEHAP